MNNSFKEWLNIEDRLVNAGKKHLEKFPDPDYGRLYWNPSLRKVHWMFGDGAGGWKEGERVFRAVKGVKDVVMADEYMPKGEGWRRLI